MKLKSLDCCFSDTWWERQVYENIFGQIGFGVNTV